MKRKRLHVVSTACALSLFCLVAYGQDKIRTKSRPNGIVQDWTRRNLLYPRVGPLHSLYALQRDPRAVLAWQESARKDWRRWKTPHPVRAPKGGLHKDWSISLGTGSTAAAMYPAKYSFDVNATPDCTNDFIAFPVNVPGAPPVTITADVTATSTSVAIDTGTITTADVGQPISGPGIPAGDTIAAVNAAPASILTLAVAATASGAGETLTVTGQPNIVGFNNLYSGTAGGSGTCNRTPNLGVDDGVSATVNWSYYINADSVDVDPPDPVNYAATSPTLSLDGTKLAFELSDPRSVWGLFIVLAPRSGDGVSTSLQDVTAPVAITSFSPTAVTPGSGTASYLLIDYDGPLSSPFVNYTDDSAYLGDRFGNLYHILNVFCATQACQTGGSPAPSLDPVWGGFNGTPTGCGGNLTSPVVDAFGNIFVGCSNGNVYGFNSSGTPLAGSPITVGNGDAVGGIVDAPVVDVVNGYLYVAAGDSAGGTAVVAQVQDLGTSMSLISTATLDLGGEHNLHAPAFNEDYFSSANPSDWLLYENSPDNFNADMDLWPIGFTADHVMNAGTPASFAANTFDSLETSPLTSFFNGTTDYLFWSDLNGGEGGSAVFQNDITGGAPAEFNFLVDTPEGEGTSGIIVDNDSGDAQASSIYFGVLGADPDSNTAVKLTQSGLQ